MLLMKPEGELQITLNDLPREIPADFTIHDLIQELHIPMVGSAVAVNHDVVPSSEWKNHKLKNQDAVLVIQASQGG